MIIKAPDQKFPTAPEGTFSAVCVDVIDLGKVENKVFGGMRNMVRLVWQIDEEMDEETAQRFKMPNGSRHIIKQDYTASLDEKAKIRKHLQSWRGRAFTPQELLGFDMETVVGVPCLLSIVHNTGSKGGTFANVGAVMKLAKGSTAIKPAGYVRVKDRKPVSVEHPELVSAPRAKPVEEGPADWDAGITDDDVPFNWPLQRRRGQVSDETMFQMWTGEAA